MTEDGVWWGLGEARTAKSEANRLYHIDRGNEHLDDKLASLGANVERVRG